MVEELNESRVSLEAYLELIADDKMRLEYYDGLVIDIKLDTVQHGLIRVNLVGLLYNCAKYKDYDAFGGNREVWIKSCKKMFFPDIVLIKGKHDIKQMSKKIKATVNPSVVIEVLSESTEERDLTIKMRCYKTLKSLKQIIVVAQKEKYIRVLERDNENERLWLDMEYFEDNERIPIGECSILLKDIYRKVTFDNQPERATEA